MTDITALQSEILGLGRRRLRTRPQLEAVRVAALGKKGRVSALLATMGGLPPRRAQDQGPSVQRPERRRHRGHRRARSQLADTVLEARLASEKLDVTLPARPENSGSVHPIAQVMEEMTAIFADQGFAVAEGPEIEDDYNFTKLNIPPDHPARQMQDTFYVAAQADGSPLCCAPTPRRCRSG